MLGLRVHATRRATRSHEDEHQLSFVPLSLITYETLRQRFLATEKMHGLPYDDLSLHIRSVNYYITLGKVIQ